MKLSHLAIVLTVFFILLSPSSVSPEQTEEKQDKIVENVGVNYWLVPVLAVDKSGKSIIDLKESDIEVKVNNQRITNFTLVRRSLDVTETTQTESKTKPQPSTGVKRVVVLLFDFTMSGRKTVNQSKAIAEKIISEADPDTRFILMGIEPFSGLKYITESIGNNKMLLDRLAKKTSRKLRTAPISEMNVGTGGAGGQNGRVRERMDEEDKVIAERQEEALNQRIILPFLNSFQTLYFYLNGIQGSKFVYFFSNGIPNSISKSVPDFGDVAEKKPTTQMGRYNYWLKKAATNINRSGSIFFLINPAGTHHNSDDVTRGADSTPNTIGWNPTADNGGKRLGSDGILSGEGSLRYLAAESGGKYIEGTETGIATQVKNMQSGFYEISFRDIPGIKGSERKISIKSKRKGVSISSIRTMEASKTYAQMNRVEREVLASNLISPNPLVKRKITAYNAAVGKVKRGKKKVVYKLQLPPSFVNKSLDLYKISVTGHKKKHEAARIVSIDKQEIKATRSKLQVVFDLKQIKKSKKEKSEGEVGTYFVLIDPSGNRARVHGLSTYDPDPEIMALEAKTEKALAKKKRKSGKTIAPEELSRILTGAADYCDRLKQSAFHFFCKESISEIHKPLASSTGRETTIADAQKVRNNFSFFQQTRNAKSSVNRHEFSYRLLKQGPRIKEDREPYNTKEPTAQPAKTAIKPTAFFSERAVFAPVTLLDRSRQAGYNYTFLRYDKWKGRPAAVIEAVPKNASRIGNSVWGDIWIDTEDFSVLKIQAAPESIRGYAQLSELAKKLRTRLHLSLETEFGELKSGIRFPTKVSSLEKYKGGRMTRYQGSAGWERTRTVFTYSDYRFFSVQSDATVQ